jgi:RloB-like protein
MVQFLFLAISQLSGIHEIDMSNLRRNRYRRPGRRDAFRDPRPIILIVCEGKKTEPEYFDGFSRACQNPRVRIELAPEHGVPKTLVETAKQYKRRGEIEAKRERDENLAYDAVWCVFDIDDHPHVGEALEMARDNAIDVAVSNPCFELWLLLHFRDNPGMQSREKTRELLKGFVPDYRKAVDYDGTYSSGYPAAAERAARIDAAAVNDGEPRRNPTTGAYKLSELIRTT